MDNYRIKWFRIERNRKITVRLFDPLCREKDSVQLDLDATNDDAVEEFIDRGSLPEEEREFVVHEDA